MLNTSLPVDCKSHIYFAKGDGMRRLILASGSPRRKELLTRVSLSFNISVSEVDENVSPENTPEEAVQMLALRKARDVAVKFPDCVVLGADTVVTIDRQILGKPKNRADALTMLSMLSGRIHTVFTGVAIVTPAEARSFFETTSVLFWDLTEEEIEDYIATGESFDKAGAYGIQGIGATLVKEIHGDYFNVVGLPLARTVRALRKAGITGILGQSRKDKKGSSAKNATSCCNADASTSCTSEE
jgi:septum formation protein